MIDKYEDMSEKLHKIEQNYINQSKEEKRKRKIQY